jgi:hypothetical protein
MKSIDQATIDELNEQKGEMLSTLLWGTFFLVALLFFVVAALYLPSKVHTVAPLWGSIQRSH